MKKQNLNFFIVQALVSSTPGVLLTSNLPLVGQHLGLAYAGIGLIFFYVRMGLLTSSLASFKLVQVLGSRKSAVLAEIVNSALAFFLLWFYFTKKSDFLFSILFLKGMTSGLLLIIRFHWLRQYGANDKAKVALTLINLISQMSYGIAGVLLLFSIFSVENVYWLIVFDAVTSVVGAFLFSSAENTEDSAAVTPPSFSFRPFLNLRFGSLFFSEALMACCMGGTNLMLVKYGSQFFSRTGGYGLTLLLYALLYGVGGIFLTRHIAKYKAVSHSKFLLFSIWVPMSLFYLGNVSPILQVVCFSVMIASYAVVYSAFNIVWFEISSKEMALTISSVRSLVIGLIWAIGEYVYGRIESDTILRAVFGVLSFVAILGFLRMSSEAKMSVDGEMS